MMFCLAAPSSHEGSGSWAKATVADTGPHDSQEISGHSLYIHSHGSASSLTDFGPPFSSSGPMFITYHMLAVINSR
jgi:hypothetical protein